jgi:hypothetical protein
MVTTYAGSCHCGKIRFTAVTDNNKVIVCNCSICRKKGTRHLRVTPAEFILLSGEDSLSKYQFGTRTASHYFCRHCGVAPFTKPRSAPDMINVNIQCLDTPALEDCDFEIVYFDGENWEQAVAALKQALSANTH